MDYVTPYKIFSFTQKKYKEPQRGEKITTCSIRIRYKDNYMHDSASVNCSSIVIWNRQPVRYSS